MTEHPLETLCARCDKRLRDHFFVDCCEDETPRPDTPRFLSRHRPNERDAELSAALTAARAESAARDAEMRKLGAERMQKAVASLLVTLSKKTEAQLPAERDPIARAAMRYELDIYKDIGVGVLSLDPATVAEGE